MKRQANPHLSSPGECALAQYQQTLREQEDLTPASVRNYLSDVRHFMAWYEQREAERATHAQGGSGFHPQAITIPALTRYRTYLQTIQRQKPASVNRSLISVKRYFGWARQNQRITYDPSAAVKLVGQEDAAPRHLHRLAQIMGHDSLDTTKLYIQGTKQDLQQAVKTIAWT